ncbi:hypothetical protein Tco_0908310 [Tanacetum coccineum]|uniref:Uncharacterized protein n=1 Tax=Tanacetum coccineum TaxID=301880 RepID=A0ABQ5CLR5_9ASTR
MECLETVREIVEEARVVKPLDNSLNYACQYTKLSQELLEYVIGTCPKSFNERDNKAPFTPVTRKKQVTFRVNDSTEASGSKPRSNTKKNRILPAKKENKNEVEIMVINGGPNEKKLTLEKLDGGSQWRPTRKKFALGEMCHLTKLSVKFVAPFEHDMIDEYDDSLLQFVVVQSFQSKICLCQNFLEIAQEFSNWPKSEKYKYGSSSYFHRDLCGPMRVSRVFKGRNTSSVIVDDYQIEFIGVNKVREVKWKEIQSIVTNFLKQNTGWPHKIADFIRTDNQTEFGHQVMSEYYGSTYNDDFLKQLPSFLWAEAVATASKNLEEKFQATADIGIFGWYALEDGL